ncbi:MAG: hypothetical protein ACLUYK_00150 [Eggerthella lenta]
MDGTIDFIVLEHDDVAGCALIAGAVDGVVPAIDGHNTPYVVAMGYDHATRNWEDCTLYDDIVKAKLTYEGLRGRGYPLDGAMRRDDSATLISAGSPMRSSQSKSRRRAPQWSSTSMPIWRMSTASAAAMATAPHTTPPGKGTQTSGSRKTADSAHR